MDLSSDDFRASDSVASIPKELRCQIRLWYTASQHVNICMYVCTYIYIYIYSSRSAILRTCDLRASDSGVSISNVLFSVEIKIMAGFYFSVEIRKQESLQNIADVLYYLFRD